MCCFSQSVKAVSDTNIFARAAKDGRQFLVYSMVYESAVELAMILPIPVPKASKEDAVRFTNLEKYEEFFKDLRAGFPPPRSKGPPTLGDPNLAPGGLVKVEVGSFIASFVPAVKDFARLDEAFRLPAGIWDKLPQYKDSGFAVFQLKKGAKKVHPMAFEFPRANTKQLFFPTVHIHDGTVKAKANFDHSLFCQKSNGEDTMSWEESSKLAGAFVNVEKAQGIVEPKAHVYRKMLHGMLKNEDIIL